MKENLKLHILNPEALNFKPELLRPKSTKLGAVKENLARQQENFLLPEALLKMS